MEKTKLITEILRLPKDAITYALGESLTELAPNKAMVHGDSGTFDVESFAKAEFCTLAGSDAVYGHVSTDWLNEDNPIVESIVAGWYDVTWHGRPFEIVWLSLAGSYCQTRYFWLLGDEKEQTEAFFAEVCRWNTRVPEVVWIFEAGHWRRSRELYTSIKDATFDRLILPDALRDELRADFKQFMDSRETYARYRVPWKRGILLTGPPGNGKTYTVKALINWLDVTCLYVKSLKSEHATDHSCIREVFRRAREATPCVLVLEDLDSLIDNKNRSFFLNEMDGFMSNDGIFVIATTNHPERLDPAIVDRPSRFDRKYRFDLPEAGMRERYLASWNESAESDLRLSPSGLATMVDATEGFSFAYLKELWLSSMMRWINTIGLSGAGPGSMDDVMAAQLVVLREQMSSQPESVDETNDASGPMAGYREAMMRAFGSRFKMHTIRSVAAIDGEDFEDDSDDE